MSGVWLLRGLRWTYATFIAAVGATALQGALQGVGESHHAHTSSWRLRSPELLAVLAFLIEPLEVAACAVLLVVYAAAAALSLASADWLALLRFAFFGTTAIYIVRASDAFSIKETMA